MELVAISGGGPRRHALLAQFETDEVVWSHEISCKAFGASCAELVPGFHVTWVDGVLGEALTSQERLLRHAGDVLSELKLSDEQMRRFGELANKARPPSRRVLGCLLANLRAMQKAAGRAIVVEDNVRVARRPRLQVLEGDLVYYGHLAHDDTMEYVHVHGRPPTEFKGELWGTYAYAPSVRLYEAVLEAIRSDLGCILRPRRRDVDVTPADKLLQRVARKRGLDVVVHRPQFFRMPPVLKSKIHTKWDRPFFVSTTQQLALYDMSWDDVWLTPAERAFVVEATSYEPKRRT